MISGKHGGSRAWAEQQQSEQELSRASNRTWKSCSIVWAWARRKPSQCSTIRYGFVMDFLSLWKCRMQPLERPLKPLTAVRICTRTTALTRCLRHLKNAEAEDYEPFWEGLQEITQIGKRHGEAEADNELDCQRAVLTTRASQEIENQTSRSTWWLTRSPQEIFSFESKMIYFEFNMLLYFGNISISSWMFRLEFML